MHSLFDSTVGIYSIHISSLNADVTMRDIELSDRLGHLPLAEEVGKGKVDW